MKLGDYEIRPFQASEADEVIPILRYLWHGDFENCRQHFAWKYEENPHADEPLGIVAARDGRVVAFRGYFAMRWYHPAEGLQFTMLHPGDTVVHPDHRLRGMSVAMGELAMDLYSADYSLFLNLSSTPSSVPGYRKLGFEPIADKDRLHRITLRGIPAFLNPRTGGKEHQITINPGRDGDIVISADVRPAAMAAVAAAAHESESALCLLQDETFFDWRLRSPHSHSFYFYREDGDSGLLGYVIIQFSVHGRRAFIADYADVDGGESVGKLLSHIIHNAHLPALTIDSVTLGKQMRDSLTRFGFRDYYAVRKLAGKTKKVCPLLVRPVARLCHERDWHLGQLDVRRVESWRINGICFDSA
jgi:hypothetical protein